MVGTDTLPVPPGCHLIDVIDAVSRQAQSMHSIVQILPRHQLPRLRVAKGPQIMVPMVPTCHNQQTNPNANHRSETSRDHTVTGNVDKMIYPRIPELRDSHISQQAAPKKARPNGGEACGGSPAPRRR